MFSHASISSHVSLSKYVAPDCHALYSSSSSMRDVTALGLQNFLSGQFLTTTRYFSVMSSSNWSYAMRVTVALVRVPTDNTFSQSSFTQQIYLRSFSRINVVIFLFISSIFVLEFTTAPRGKNGVKVWTGYRWSHTFQPRHHIHLKLDCQVIHRSIQRVSDELLHNLR